MISDQIQQTFPKLRKSEQQVAKYMLEHTEEMEQISLEQLAKKAEVSQPTVLRMLKAVGYTGFKEADTEKEAACDKVKQQFKEAGAEYVIRNFAELPGLLEKLS